MFSMDLHTKDSIQEIPKDTEQVEHPSHYNAVPNWEVIDTIHRDLSKEEYIGFLKGNILKYRLRAGYKGEALKDIAKAEYYKELLLIDIALR